MESSECESADDTDAEQLATAHCTSAQQSGGGSTPATAKADHLAADCLQKKCHRVEETTEECAVRLQSLRSYQVRRLLDENHTSRHSTEDPTSLWSSTG